MRCQTLTEFSPSGLNALTERMRLKYACRPAWLADAIALQSALIRDHPEIGKGEHLRRARNEHNVIRHSVSYRRKFSKLKVSEVYFRETSWGVVEMRWVSSGGDNDDGDPGERIQLFFRPRALAQDPRLIEDLKHRGEWWALDLVFTSWLRGYVRGYRGGAELLVGEGESFHDAAVVDVVVPPHQADWPAIGDALSVLFGGRFDALAAALISRVRSVHRAARRQETVSPQRPAQRNFVLKRNR
jgi:hypothetical protein